MSTPQEQPNTTVMPIPDVTQVSDGEDDSDAAVWVGSVQRPFVPNRDPHRGSGQLGS